LATQGPRGAIPKAAPLGMATPEASHLRLLPGAVSRAPETMAVWETQPALAARSELMADFANVWQAADKIVYSTTLHAVSTVNTRLERRFDPDSVRDMKTSDASDLTVGGPTLAAHAFAAGLVDECQRPALRPRACGLGPHVLGRVSWDIGPSAGATRAVDLCAVNGHVRWPRKPVLCRAAVVPTLGAPCHVRPTGTSMMPWRLRRAAVLGHSRGALLASSARGGAGAQGVCPVASGMAASISPGRASPRR
jgi:hypothetical protein